MHLPQSSTIIGKRKNKQRPLKNSKKKKKKQKQKKHETLIHAETIQVCAVQKVASVDLEGKETEGLITVSCKTDNNLMNNMFFLIP